MNNTNNVGARMGFEKAWKIFYDAWLPSFVEKFGAQAADECTKYVDSLKWSQVDIRLETLITNTGTTFSFALTDNIQNSANLKFNTEYRLTMQDSLVACEYGIYIAQTASNTDSAFQIRTYPNTVDFIAADVAALSSSFYCNGTFRITCNKDVIMPNRALWNHLYVPQTQQTAALGADSPKDQICPANDGLITDEPNILLIGSKGYQMEITIPQAMSSATLSNVRGILFFKGWLAQNSTPVS